MRVHTSHAFLSEAAKLTGGLKEMKVLKTTQSGFVGETRLLPCMLL